MTPENRGGIAWALLQRIKRAAHADAGSLCRVQIDFRRGNIRMAKQVLNIADAGATRQQMGRSIAKADDSRVMLKYFLRAKK